MSVLSDFVINFYFVKILSSPILFHNLFKEFKSFSISDIVAGISSRSGKNKAYVLMMFISLIKNLNITTN